MRVFKILDPDPYKKVPVPVYGFATLSLSIYAIVATGRARLSQHFYFEASFRGKVQLTLKAASSPLLLATLMTGYRYKHNWST